MPRTLAVLVLAAVSGVALAATAGPPAPTPVPALPVPMLVAMAGALGYFGVRGSGRSAPSASDDESPHND